MTDDQPRAGLWLPLLRRLTEQVDSWTVWKGADPAFRGPEDVDAVAARTDWPLVEDIFAAWAGEAGFPVVVCRHIPATLNLFALVEDGRSLLQLEVRDANSFRGSVQFTARDLRPLAHLDPRGFRTLRPGAEGVLKLTLHALRRGGRPDRGALADHDIVAMLRDDPEAARRATRLFGAAAAPLSRAVDAAVDGGWDRRALLTVELRAALRALGQPQIGVRRVWFRAVTRSRCAVLQTVYRDRRRIPGDLAAWIEMAARDHRVIRADGHPHRCPTAGRFVALVGPDGVGKTTVARALLERHRGPTGYVYFRPPLRGRLPSTPPSGPRPRGDKQPPRQPRVMGWLRLAKNIVWFWGGYLAVVRPVLRSGGLVVGDRWGYGYVGQPGPLRFFGPSWLARVGVKLLPQPDLVANLTASATTVVARKDELSTVEVTRESAAWRRLPLTRMHTFDAELPAGEVAARISDALGATVRP